MNEMKFTIEVQATKEKVWDTLWQDQTFRDWAGLIDPGTHMVGDLIEGKDVQFISGNGYGVTSFVEKLVLNQFLLLRHKADTQENGTQERKKEWTGTSESYELVEEGDTTLLTTVFTVPPEQVQYFEENYPMALDRVKELAEKTD